MKAWLRRLLGTYDIDERLKAIEMQMHQYRGLLNQNKGLLNQTKNNVGLHDRALGRIIAKLDPNYGLDELDPRRKAESDALGDAVIKKLKAEHAASNKLTEDFE